MICAVCGHNNPSGAQNCGACGAALGLSATGTPLSGAPGIATGGTSSHGIAHAAYSANLPRGVRLNNGNYAVGEVLGQGGFGITYKGGDLSLRRYVAIKEFFPQGCARQNSTVQPAGTLSAADYAGVKAKFIEEARTLARFSDPGIVRVFGVFEENNTAYMVMEFLEGSTLSKRISEAGTINEAEAVSIAEKVGGALKVVHEAGIIHRDLKPDNICLTKDGRVVLIDFGTARAFASGKTVKQTTMLTPGYAPLEQYGQQARFGAYTDIYALAATLYHAITGQVPPQATDRAAGVELKAPRELNPRLSKTFSDALVWAMSVKASERPQNVGTFLDAIKRPQAAPLVPATAVDLDKSPASTTSGWGNSAPTSSPFTPAPIAATAGAQVTQITENQLLTNASPPEVLRAIQRSFVAFGINQPNVDAPNYRVVGRTGLDLRSNSQEVTGQVTQDGRGVMVTVNSRPANAMTVSDYGRGKDETRRLLALIATELNPLPADPLVSMATAPAAPQTNPYAPIADPRGNPYGGGGYSPAQRPFVQQQGGTVLTYGILGFFCCGIFSIVAWVNGNNALAAYGDNDPGDRGTVQAGRIMGIIGTVLWGLYLSAIVVSSLSGN